MTARATTAGSSRGTGSRALAQETPGTTESTPRSTPTVHGGRTATSCAPSANEGDRLILKRPSGRRWEILAVGKVTSPYYFESRLEDVEGWDLQHALNVEWRVGEPNVVDGLSRGTLRRVGKSELCELADRLWEDWRPVQREALPTAPDEVEDDDLVERLIDHGVPTDRAELIASTIWQIRKLASWYQRRGSNVGEHEIRTFLIVPLLLALGWAEQRIKSSSSNST